ncbi:MAG: hypothetical protein R8L07_14850 [Alphaproteobacteria bacterium]|nr:hypothetical protein [Alphaproteobacteria bacterium]
MRMGRNAARAVLIGTLALATAACSSPPDEIIACPTIRIPLDTERVTRFADGPGRDITDVVMQAEIKFLSGECTVDEDEIEMTFPIAIRGVRGPADRDGVEQIEVFLAVTNRDRDVLQRRELPMTLKFVGNRTSIVSSDFVTIQIPKELDQTSKEFLVFLGLKLSKEELEYNRSESGR